MKKKLEFLVLAFIIISSIYFMNTTTSRYLSQVNSVSDLDVAIPQISMDVGEVTNNLMLPGDSREVEFYVKNYDTRVNDVLMEYYINVDFIDSTIPVSYKIYDITDNSETLLSETSNGFGPITLKYGTEEDRHFKIIFTWDEKDNSTSYAGKQFSFKIEVNATQEV